MIPLRGLWLTICVGLLTSAGTDPARGDEPFDILYYGNSFTNATCCGATSSVPALVSSIATAAGRETPRQFNASVNGQSIAWHLANNTAAITTGITPGESWDFVVLQDFSTMPTHIGNLSQHVSSMTTMYQTVAAHSPDVTAIGYETWARGPTHSYYAGANPTFPGGPAEMQQELRDGYQMSVDNINLVAGDLVASVAPAGDAWEAGLFDLDLYAGDIYHASNQGTLLNALVLYGTIYGDTTTSDINLSGVLPGLGLTVADSERLTSLADAVLVVPEPHTGVSLISGVFLLVWRRRERHGATRH